MERNIFLNPLKQITFGTNNENALGEEKFQNITIRPILKTQNDLFIAIFRNYAIKNKNVFFGLTADKKENYIENAIQKDIKFRNLLKGVVIGLFTVEEFQDYTENSSNLNKRMMNLLIERLKSQTQII